jgi:hypothetical protein
MMRCPASTARRSNKAPHVLALLVAVWVAGAASAHAQLVDGADSSRPYRGLFGGAAAGTSDRPQTLDINAALFGGYDDDIFARGDGPRSPNARVGGKFVGGQLAANYFHRMPNALFSLDGSSAVRWVASSQEFVPTFYAAGVGYTTAIGPRNSVALRHTTAYRPFFSVVPFAGIGTIGATLQNPSSQMDAAIGPSQGPDDFTVSADRRALQHVGLLQFGRRLSPRSTVDLIGNYGVTDFGTSELDDVNNVRWRAAARYMYDLTRFASLRLGYGYRTLGTSNGRTIVNHDIDVGLQYSQPFVFQRGRTQFAFTTGTTLLVRDRLSSEAGGGDRTIFRAVGMASLSHAFRAPWQTQLNYTRTVGFLDGLSEPFQGDQVMANVGGLIGRRVDVAMSAGYLSGAIGFRDRNFDTALASARARVALSQNLALFAQYFYYQYAFDEAVTTRLIVAPELERQGVRIGLTVWVPVLR